MSKKQICAACADTPIYRSVKSCDRCGASYQKTSQQEAYCNSAWKICIGCSQKSNCCVVCEKQLSTKGENL